MPPAVRRFRDRRTRPLPSPRDPPAAAVRYHRAMPDPSPAGRPSAYRDRPLPHPAVPRPPRRDPPRRPGSRRRCRVSVLPERAVRFGPAPPTVPPRPARKRQPVSGRPMTGRQPTKSNAAERASFCGRPSARLRAGSASESSARGAVAAAMSRPCSSSEIRSHPARVSRSSGRNRTLYCMRSAPSTQ